ncbi:MAG TPA: tRNA guanosine(34) transglycosylase Tgt, partial [Acidimicrobiaceae bacterium]|nr:tRNA guanosine(34) transglycosylase Tgt [Acidimicrobiaceae bacterium]
IDMFDCVLPTRHARHGTILTSTGRLNLRNARFATDESPLDPGFPSSPATPWSRAYLRHLLLTDEPTGRRLLTLHNLAWLFDFVERLRSSIVEGRFEAFRAETHAVWG